MSPYFVWSLLLLMVVNAACNPELRDGEVQTACSKNCTNGCHNKTGEYKRGCKSGHTDEKCQESPHSVSSIIDICVVSIFSVLVLFGLIFCCTRIMRQRRSGNIDSKPMELHEIPLSHTSPPQQPTVHETFTPRAASVYYNEVQENVRHETIREDSSKLDGHLKPIMKSYSDQSVSLDLKSSVKIQEVNEKSFLFSVMAETLGNQ